ncbi:unnamed protein product [Fraxinus pennsylvanica]|uniref:Uncharacterized protein n=1 Tax=Fraxinus pennsylvanica TaxID=56036 RepID=A0AAD2ECN9_9LAMI|nr:unnamed protein product [Fraxinus pennsylvanica]
MSSVVRYMRMHAKADATATNFESAVEDLDLLNYEYEQFAGNDLHHLFLVLMCSGSKSKNCHFDLEMEAEFQENKGRVAYRNCSNLLELAATHDLDGFICEAEERGCDIDVKVFT